MRIMRKISVIFVGSILLAGTAIVLSGCGTEKIKEPETSKEYAKATLFCDVSHWNPPVWDIKEGTVTSEISKRTGLMLDVEVPSQDADTKLKIMLVNDELPDLISVTDTTVISQLVTSGKVWELEEFLKKYKPDSHLLKTFPEDIKRELIKRDGGWYALSSHINSEDARKYWGSSEYWNDFVKYSDNNAIVWNKELLKKAELEKNDLRTETQVLAAFEKVKNMGIEVNGKEVIPFLVDGQDYQDPTLKYLEGTFGAEWVDDNGDYTDILLQPQTKNAFSFFNTAMRNGYASPEQITMERSEIRKIVGEGRVFCFCGNMANASLDYNKWTSTGTIRASDGSKPVMGKNIRASTGWISTFISKDCENPEEIAAFIDYMTSEEGLAVCLYGWEGQDYTVGEDGLFYRTEEGLKKLDEGKELGLWWMFSNTVWERSVGPVGKEGENQLEVLTSYGRDENTVLYDSSLLLMESGWIPRESPEGKMENEIEIWKSKQLIQVLLAESEEEFEQEYDRFIQGLYDRGIEKLDQKKNEGYRKNCKEYGGRILKINRTKVNGDEKP